MKHFPCLLIPVLILLLCGFGEPVKPPVKQVPRPQIATVQPAPIELPEEVYDPDFPAERRVVQTEDLSLAQFQGDNVFAEDQNFFVVGGKKQQMIHLEPGVNDVFIMTIVNGQNRIAKKRILLDMLSNDVPRDNPDMEAIRYMYLLRIMAPYMDEGGLFLPENGVPSLEFSLVLNQAVQEKPRVLTFSRAGDKNYIDVRSALPALERSFGAPDKPWPEILGDDYLTPEKALTRAQLARLLFHMRPVKEKVDLLKKEFNI
jgi:hypothetical protein